MKKPNARQAVVAIVSMLALVGILLLAQRSVQGYAAPAGSLAGRAPAGAPLTRAAVRSDVSPPLRSIKAIEPSPATLPAEKAPDNPRLPGVSGNPFGPDPMLQHGFGALAMPTPALNIEGQPNLWAVFPPDTNGDVGRNHYIQIVNSGFEIYTKTGTSLYGPANTNTLFTGFGGLCETTNNGDPIALYDPLADRWLMSQFAIAANGLDTHQCFAISTSPDPLGSYYRYDFHTSPVPTTFEDYPHIGVWPDAYYMTTNESSGGGGAFAFNRIKMLQGDPTAQMVYFLSPVVGMLPSDLDGPPPPAGRPNFFLGLGPSLQHLQEYEFHVDFVTPANSSFTGPFLITVPPYNETLCSGARGACIDQPGTTVKLEAITDRLMYRLQYRNIPGGHETLIVNHTVNANGGNPGLAGIRWYEIRDPFTTTMIFANQAGTYSPDTNHRWMGSAAMDRFGDIAVGYSVSSSVVSPSMRYAGRLVTDPLNTLAQGEASFIEGGGSQLRTQSTNDGRWGDYSMLAVDPVDDCTYWYTNEYIRRTTDIGWTTRIGSFKFPGCAGQATPTAVPSATGVPLPASPTPQPSPTACAGAVTVTGVITSTDPTMNGRLSRGNPPGTCANPRPYPGAVTGPTPHYDVYTYTNTLAAPQCVTVTLDSRSCGGPGVFGSAYLNSFDPNNLQTNYLADLGTSGPVASFSFSVPASTTYVVVVQEIGTDLGCASYTLTVNPCGPPSTPGTATRTPTLQPSATGTATAGTGSTSTPARSATAAVGSGTPTAVSTTAASSTATTAATSAATSPASTATRTSTGTATAGTPAATYTACPIQFTDVPNGQTFYPWVRCLACRGIVSGYNTGCGTGNPCFKPNNNVTRGQLSKIVSNSAGFNEAHSAQDFQDVSTSDSFYIFIERLYSRGIVGGYPCGGAFEPCGPGNLPYFRPGANATRGQITKIDANAAGYSDPPAGQQFEDLPPGQAFYTYTYQLYTRGIMGGYACGGAGEPCGPGNLPYFRPNNNATRGQTSKIVANTFFPNCETPVAVKP